MVLYKGENVSVSLKVKLRKKQTLNRKFFFLFSVLFGSIIMYIIGYYWYNDQIVQITYYAKGSSGNVQYVLKGYLKVHQLEGDFYSGFLRG